MTFVNVYCAEHRVQPAMFCSWGKGRVSHSTALSFFYALRRGHQRAVEPGCY